MSPLLKEMIDLLVELEQLCGRMILLTKSEREALIDNDPEKINLVADSKNILSRKIVDLRDRVRELTPKLAPEGVGVKTIGQLLSFLSEEERKSIFGPYAAYKAKAREVEFYNAHNNILARQGMKAVEGRVLELVAAIQGVEATYQPPGRAAEPTAPRLGRVHREV